MNKIKPIILGVFFVCLVFLVVLGWQLGHVNNSLTTSDTCYLENNSCHFGDSEAVLSINFVQAPKIESETFIKFFVLEEFFIHQAWIEGVNMYMGTIPVMFETTPQEISNPEGIFFLGSCTQAKMQWQLNVILKHKKTEDLKKYSVVFNTIAE